VCSASGDTVKFSAPGSCFITATQAGNAEYASATPMSQTVTVTYPLT
jgi:hypothetical protein